MMDDTFSQEAFERGEYDVDENERQFYGGLPCILVMNKVDLVTNKRRMR
jgi:GTPase